MRKTPVQPWGDSMTRGDGSTDSNGYRLPLLQLAIADRKEIVLVGGVQTGTFSDNWHEGYSGAGIATTQVNSRPTRLLMQPEWILMLSSINNLFGAATVAALVTAFGVAQDELWDFASHAIPGGVNNVGGGASLHGSTLRGVVVSTLLRCPFDPAAAAKAVAYNGLLPGLVATQQAMGRNVILADGYAAVGTNISGDGVHPDDVGYAALARCFWDAMKAFVRTTT